MHKSLYKNYLWCLVLIFPFFSEYPFKVSLSNYLLFSDIKDSLCLSKDIFENYREENLNVNKNTQQNNKEIPLFAFPKNFNLHQSGGIGALNNNDLSKKRHRKKILAFVAAQGDLTRCIAQIEEINTISAQEGNDEACLSCDPTLGKCPAGCQIFIEKLWRFCRGVTLPDGTYYDPRLSVTGTWDDEVDKLMIIEANRCGCDPAMSLFKNMSLLKVLIINVSISAGILFLMS